MKVLVAGKGGVGKTTVSALLSIIFAREGYKVIALDTDSVPNLAQNLGIPYEEADKIVPLSRNYELTEERTGARPGEGWGILFSLTPKVDDLPEKIGIRTPDGILLIVVGGIQQPKEGCLCPSIALARALLLHLLLSEKEVVIVDAEAGAEVFGRGLAEKFDVMLCVSEPTYKSMLIARKLLEMGEGLGISKEFLIINKVQDEVLASQIYHKIFGGGVPYFFVRYDENVIKLENEGKGLNLLPKESPSYSDVKRLFKKIRRCSRMCESEVVIRREGKEEVVMEDVALMFFRGDKIVFKDIMGNEKVLDANKLEMIDLINHKIYVKGRGREFEGEGFSLLSREGHSNREISLFSGRGSRRVPGKAGDRP